MEILPQSIKWVTPIDHSTTQRPTNRRANHRPELSDSVFPAVKLRAAAEWLSWPELTVRLNGIHQQDTTYSLWKNFAVEGEITFIELFEGRDGKREGRGKIRFSPPPKRDFWSVNGGRYSIKMEDGTM